MSFGNPHQGTGRVNRYHNRVAYSYDQIAEFYDEDMGRNNPGNDVPYYVSACRSAREPILELGCGTGRVTIPLVKNGLRVVGIDRSLPMLKILRKKVASVFSPEEGERLSYCQADMRSFYLKARFSFILCPFSSFTYLTEPAHLRLLFKRVRSHLAPGGEFIFDLFVPHRNVDALPDSHVFHDYCRTLADGTLLKRTKTIQKNIRPNINLIERKYRLLDSSERTIRTVTTTDLIRYYHPREIKKLLLSNGFQISTMLADFEEGELSESTGTVCIRCRPRAFGPKS